MNIKIIYQEMKKKKNKKININQKSFYFEDYLATNQFSKKRKSQKFLMIEFLYYFFLLYV